MTEQKARESAAKLAFAMGIRFHVVRSPEGDFQTVQTAPDGCAIVSTAAPPTSVHDQGLERRDYAEPEEDSRSSM
jgi:hypothetical protein